MQQQSNTAKAKRVVDYFITPEELALARRSTLARSKSAKVAKDYLRARARARMQQTINTSSLEF